MASITILSNPGSASKKYSVYQSGTQIADFHFENEQGKMVCSGRMGNMFKKESISDDVYKKALKFIFDQLIENKYISTVDEIEVVAVRSVIPDPQFVFDKILNTEDIKNIQKLKSYDPLHITSLLDELLIAQKIASKKTKICLISDSTFHLSSKRRLPISLENDVYTIGYHGLSCESVIEVLNKHRVEYSKLCICHLGSGSSITSVRGQRSMYNSMEYSPLDGVVMSSRTGSLDPFLVLKMMKEKKLTYPKALSFLYKDSGLLALSKVSPDLRTIRAESFKGNDDAKDAILAFVDSIVAHICKAISYSEGMDTLVFTGTIGCRASYIREMVTAKLLWLGIIINHDRNIHDTGECIQISSYDSKIKVYIVEIDEMKQMYTHVQNLIS